MDGGGVTGTFNRYPHETSFMTILFHRKRFRYSIIFTNFEILNYDYNDTNIVIINFSYITRES